MGVGLPQQPRNQLKTRGWVRKGVREVGLPQQPRNQLKTRCWVRKGVREVGLPQQPRNQLKTGCWVRKGVREVGFVLGAILRLPEGSEPAFSSLLVLDHEIGFSLGPWRG